MLLDCKRGFAIKTSAYPRGWSYLANPFDDCELSTVVSLGPTVWALGFGPRHVLSKTVAIRSLEDARCVTASQLPVNRSHPCEPARKGSCWPITPRPRPTTWRRRQSHSPPSTIGPAMGRCPPHPRCNFQSAEALSIWVARPRMPPYGRPRPSQSGSPTARLSGLSRFVLAVLK